MWDGDFRSLKNLPETIGRGDFDSVFFELMEEKSTGRVYKIGFAEEQYLHRRSIRPDLTNCGRAETAPNAKMIAIF